MLTRLGIARARGFIAAVGTDAVKSVPLVGEWLLRVEDVDQLTPMDALKLGLAQACALIPGTSRSGATILLALMLGLLLDLAALLPAGTPPAGDPGGTRGVETFVVPHESQTDAMIRQVDRAMLELMYVVSSDGTMKTVSSVGASCVGCTKSYSTA